MHDFNAKRNALFACLDDASNELKGTLLDQTKACTALRRTDEGDLVMNYRNAAVKRNKRNLHHLSGKESIFKRPELPIARCVKPRRLPDYQLNPHKWKKYSLEDVDISDQTNSTAAFDFLRQIDEQKDSISTAADHDGEEKRIEFKKSSKMRRNLKSIEFAEQKDVEVDSPKLKGSKLYMPEYVIGQKKTDLKKKSGLMTAMTSGEKRERAAGKLLLSHLQEDDED